MRVTDFDVVARSDGIVRSGRVISPFFVLDDGPIARVPSPVPGLRLALRFSRRSTLAF